MAAPRQQQRVEKAITITTPRLFAFELAALGIRSQLRGSRPTCPAMRRNAQVSSNLRGILTIAIPASCLHGSHADFRVRVLRGQPDSVGLHAPVLFGTCHHISQGGAAPERQADSLYASARHTHHISGEQSFTRTSAGFGNRVLVGDPLHNSARNGSTAGKIAGTKDAHGQCFVEPAELHRVYPAVADAAGNAAVTLGNNDLLARTGPRSRQPVWTFAVLAHLAAPRGCCGDLADDLESGHGLSMRPAPAPDRHCRRQRRVQDCQIACATRAEIRPTSAVPGPGRTDDEMYSGAGGTPQRDVHAVVRHIVRKPDLHVLACSGAAIEHGGHA